MAEGKSTFRDLVYRNYAQIDLKGREGLILGDFEPYSDDTPEKYRNRFHTSLTFLPESASLFKKRVLEPILEKARNLGIELVYPGTGQPALHSTLLDGMFKGQDQTVSDRTFDKLKEDHGFESEFEPVRGK
ncbi:MAG: hypothetical protein COU85_00365 [Candidatus Portnoybacteria bacterium CG10_big_fil_rev_8_21_14_0_10_44_7]|uniref:Uncharacterized protein n=1 Tax=Candidatus Portnoybacteria bacterium CG10_big_fil_rev_8_21_14_0_10_44_7 TaxID=1974816 RepID=A0A2M8KJE6_9BACT|nr:MAG: hypothetical protein COU85_00365 [Candidatus Portnoybacteria bacterium CG10_big_fil_rev_8_21_14_0_10_44_7]